MQKKQTDKIIMKNTPRKKKSQYYPFVDGSDRAQPFIVGWENPSFGDISWRAFAKGIRRHSGKDSMILKILVSEYQRKAKTAGIDAALAYFWEYQTKLSPKILNNDMRRALINALNGDAAATQVIVRACPDAIHLPFIASNMAAIMRKYKYSKVGKRQDGRDAYVENKQKDSLEDIRDAWEGFLPKRYGGDVPYADEDLTRVVKKARQQKSKDEIDLYAEVGNEMNVSKGLVKKKVKIKEGRGRPKNKGK